MALLGFTLALSQVWIFFTLGKEKKKNAICDTDVRQAWTCVELIRSES